jgi:DNA-nicking Smr family endonuclease
MRIDLHGCHIHEGWARFKREVDRAYYLGHKQCSVITGQGAMMVEFPTWANNHPLVRECNQQRYNPGSFLIRLKKKG